MSASIISTVIGQLPTRDNILAKSAFDMALGLAASGLVFTMAIRPKILLNSGKKGENRLAFRENRGKDCHGVCDKPCSHKEKRR
jgi:hypothetical protein